VTEEQIEESNSSRRVSIVIGIFFVILVGFIVFASLTYNKGTFTGMHIYESPKGEKFTLIEGKAGDIEVYDLQINSERYGVEHLYQIPLRNLPEDVKIISLSSREVKKILNAKGIFITLDPNLKAYASIGAIELAGVLGTADFGVFKIPTQGAFTEKIDSDYPVKTCEDAKDGVIVITLILGDENRIDSEGDCIIVKGDSYENLIKSSERLIYGLFGVL